MCIGSPYKGLNPYSKDDRHNFFGRQQETQILINKILAHRLTLLFAATGVGKSSLLQAAVIPQLEDAQQENLAVVHHNHWVKPALATVKTSIFNKMIKAQEEDEEAFDQDLKSLSLPEMLHLFCSLLPNPPLILILDQFEEFFQYQMGSTEFTDFIEQLTECITDHELSLAVVISMREDFALELNAFKPALPRLLFENFYRLERLTEAQAKLAIIEPLKNYHVDYEEALIDTLLEDLSKPDVLRGMSRTPVGHRAKTIDPPYLQIVCNEFWLRESKSKNHQAVHLSLSTYQKHGSSEGLTRIYVEQLLGGFSDAQKKVASKAFEHLVSRRGTKQAYSIDKLAEAIDEPTSMVLEILQKLEEGRVLRSQQWLNEAQIQDKWYELYHDLFSTIIEDWNKLFKQQQADIEIKKERRRFVLKAVGYTSLAIVLTAIVYVGSEAWRNGRYGGYHYLHNNKQTGNIELWQGDLGSLDIFNQQRFIQQTGFTHYSLNVDQQFSNRSIEYITQALPEVIEKFSVSKRLQAYLQAGEFEKAFLLADMVLTRSNNESLQTIRNTAQHLVAARSPKALNLLHEYLGRIKSSEIKQVLLESLYLNSAPQASLPLLLETLPDKDNPNRRLRTYLLEALEKHIIRIAGTGSPASLASLIELIKTKDVFVSQVVMKLLPVFVINDETIQQDIIPQIIKRLKDKNDDIRRTAIDVLNQLKTQNTAPEMVSTLIATLKDENDYVRKTAADVLGSLKAQEVVPALILALKDKSERVRSAAADVLGQLKAQEVVPALIAALKDESVYVRNNAADILGQLKAQEAVPALIAALKDKSEPVRKTAADVLGQLKAQEAVPALIAALKDKSEPVRKTAADVLGQLKAQEAVPALIAALKDESEYVRNTAANVLGRLKAQEAVPALIAALKDKNKYVRNTAANVLGRLKAQAAVPALIVALKDKSEDVRSAAANVLGRLKAQAAVPALIVALKDKSEDVRSAAADALSQLKAQAAVPALIAALKDESEHVRKSAADALGRLKAQEAMSALIAALNDESGYVRKTAVDVLGQFKAQEAVPALIAALNDESEYVRKTTADVLGSLKAQEVVPALIAALKDESEDVRKKAADVLGSLKAQEAVPALITALKDKNEVIHWNAIKLLGQFRIQEAIPTLIEDLEDKSRFIRTAAANVLGQLKAQEAVPALIAALKDESDLVRWTAAYVLGSLKAQAAVPALIVALKDENEDIRKTAADALSRLKAQEAVPALIVALKDENELVRWTAADVLGSLKAQAAVPALILALKDESERVRSAAAADALGRLKAQEAVPVLIEVLKHSTGKTRQSMISALDHLSALSSSPSLRQKLWWEENIQKEVAILEKLHSIQHPKDLLAFLQSSDRLLRQYTADTLSTIRFTDAVPDLMPLLKDAEWTVRLQAMKSLQDLKAIDAIETLIPVLQDSEWPVRMSAIQTLVAFKAYSAIPALTRLLRDTRREVRAEAIAALVHLQAREAIPELMRLLQDKESDGLAQSAARALLSLGSYAGVYRLEPYRQAEDADAVWWQWPYYQPLPELCDLNLAALQKRLDELLEQHAKPHHSLYLETELGYAIARLEPQKAGLELLSHPLAHVRQGASLGLGQLCENASQYRAWWPELLKRQETDDNAFTRYAAYRAIDHCLITLEVVGDEEDVTILDAIQTTSLAVRERIAWTREQIRFRAGAEYLELSPAQEARETFMPNNRINPEGVPPGMRVVKTPFGDRLVPIK